MSILLFVCVGVVGCCWVRTNYTALGLNARAMSLVSVPGTVCRVLCAGYCVPGAVYRVHRPRGRWQSSRGLGLSCWNLRDTEICGTQYPVLLCGCCAHARAMFSQKACLVKWDWQIFHRGFLVPICIYLFIFLRKRVLYNPKTSIKYLPSPLN